MSGTVPPPPPPPPGSMPGPEGTPEPGVPPRVPSARRMPPSFSPSAPDPARSAAYGQPDHAQPHAFGPQGYGREAYAPPQPQVPPGGYAGPATHPVPPARPDGGSGRRRRGRLTGGWIAFIAVDAVLLVVAVVFAVQVLGGGSPSEPGPGAGAEAQAGQDAGGQDGAGDDRSQAPAEVLAQFASPSRNITCEITTAGASCGIAELDKQPAPVEGCDGTTGYVVALDGDGRVSLPCVPSSEQPEKASEGADVLEYGESITEGDYTCSSAESGMSCAYDPSGRGFSLARAGIGTF